MSAAMTRRLAGVVIPKNVRTLTSGFGPNLCGDWAAGTLFSPEQVATLGEIAAVAPIESGMVVGAFSIFAKHFAIEGKKPVINDDGPEECPACDW